MWWLAIFNTLCKLVLEALRRLEAKQQLDRARTEAAYELIKKANEMVNDVPAIVKSVSNSPADIVSDGANRDRTTDSTGSGNPG